MKTPVESGGLAAALEEVMAGRPGWRPAEYPCGPDVSDYTCDGWHDQAGSEVLAFILDHAAKMLRAGSRPARVAQMIDRLIHEAFDEKGQVWMYVRARDMGATDEIAREAGQIR